MSSLRALLAMCAVLVTVLASTSASAWTPPATEVAPTQTTTKAKTRVGDFCKRGAFSLRAPALLLVGTHQENRVARAKSTSEACFLTQDPIGVAGGANLYAFVGNSPLDHWDPFGLAKGMNPASEGMSEVTNLHTPFRGGLMWDAMAETDRWWNSGELGWQIAAVPSQFVMSLAFSTEQGLNTALNTINELSLSQQFWSRSGDQSSAEAAAWDRDAAVAHLTNAGWGIFEAGTIFAPFAKPATTTVKQMARGGRQAAGGQWARVTESMSERAAAYQTRVAGSTGEAFIVGGVKFDGVVGGVLIDAKGPGYASFVQNGAFRRWWTGADGFVSQARRQLSAAGGAPIQWHFAEEAAADATRALFSKRGISGIEVIFAP